MTFWVAGATVVGGLVAANAASSGADKQAAAANNAAALSDAQYQQTRADQAPYREAGVNALANVQRMAGNVPGAFNFSGDAMYSDPGYQFRLSEGQRAMAHNAGNRGGLVSGTSLKAMQDYAQNSASGEYNNAYNRALTSYNTGVASENQLYNRQAGIAGIGQSATNFTNAAGANNANTMSGYLTSGAAAQAAGGVGVGNAATSGLGTYLNYTSNNNLLNALKKSPTVLSQTPNYGMQDYSYGATFP